MLKSDTYHLCPTHKVQYPNGSTCPKCEKELEGKMDIIEVLDNLCYYDERNPSSSDHMVDAEDKAIPRTNCFCDNCFYGRDKLALETKREGTNVDAQRFIIKKAEEVAIGLKPKKGRINPIVWVIIIGGIILLYVLSSLFGNPIF